MVAAGQTWPPSTWNMTSKAEKRKFPCWLILISIASPSCRSLLTDCSFRWAITLPWIFTSVLENLGIGAMVWIWLEHVPKVPWASTETVPNVYDKHGQPLGLGGLALRRDEARPVEWSHGHKNGSSKGAWHLPESISCLHCSCDAICREALPEANRSYHHALTPPELSASHQSLFFTGSPPQGFHHSQRSLTMTVEIRSVYGFVKFCHSISEG